MKALSTQKKRVEVLDLLAIGSALLTTALLLYPAIAPKDAGIVSTGAKALLIAPGLLCLVAALAMSIKARKAIHP